jgi:nitrate reductase alpha subunit
MSHLLDRLTFFKRNVESFSAGHGTVTNEPRDWENAYRQRWAHDKIVRSTHGVNCTGSCSWKIYVKGGVVAWETQQTDYPRTRPELPNHEPRGCARGASYSWYLYSANRVKYPMMRKRLLKLWRAAKAEHGDPVLAWRSIQADEAKRREYQKVRGLGGFVRVRWEEAEELIAAANVHTAKTHGPDRIFGFSPIPAMSMVSYAAGSRYLSLIGGVCMSFYDWYCDLPPSSPQTWGEQTDVPESADWYNAGFLMMWGSNVPQTRTPDAHFMTEARYRGAKTVVVCPDYSEASKFADLWLHPKQGTDAALAMAMGHVILKEWHAAGRGEYFAEYCRKYTDMPMLVLLKEQDGRIVPERQLRAGDLDGALGEANNPDWKTVAVEEGSDRLYAPTGSIGFRWGEKGKWNLEGRDARTLEPATPRLSLLGGETVADVAFPYFGNRAPEFFNPTSMDEVLTRRVPAIRVRLKDGTEALAATVFDLFLANYGVERGYGDCAASYDEVAPYTPAWAEQVCGTPRGQIVTTAREFADNAEKTNGRSMVILGAAVNHWYHGDMIYRGIINLLVMCGCVGQSGGGWSHYVGQEKLRPQTGWVPLAFATDWSRPPRQINSTSAWYQHTDQWRYERLGVDELLSPTAPKRMAGLPHRLQRACRAHGLAALRAAAAGQPAAAEPRGSRRGPGPGGLHGRTADGRLACHVLRGSGQPGELAAQPVHLALEPAGLLRQGARVLPEAPARHHQRRAGQGPGRRGRREAAGGGVARPGAGGEARPAGHARLPHEHDLHVLRHRAANGHLVREARPQHLGHAPLHPSAVGGGGPGVGGADGLGDLQGDRAFLLAPLPRPPRRGAGRGADPAHARHGAGAGAEPRGHGVAQGRVPGHPRQDHAGDRGGGARLPEHLRPLHRDRAAAREGGERRQGHLLEDGP